MRTTVEIPDRLMQDALRTSGAKTKTMTIVLGLQELLNRHRLEQLRALRGGLRITVDVRKARRRR